MENIHMQIVNDRLRFLFGCVGFLLDINQEPVEMINGHDPVLGIFPEERLDVGRRLRDGHVEATLEAEAYFVGLFGHWDCWVRGGLRNRGDDRLEPDWDPKRTVGVITS
ncbi:hypothetical protein QYF36_025751 [Acer negundo]|nr:hypothetical protein QYF36_025751 [Acer negundo]